MRAVLIRERAAGNGLFGAGFLPLQFFQCFWQNFQTGFARGLFLTHNAPGHGVEAHGDAGFDLQHVECGEELIPGFRKAPVISRCAL